VLKRDVKLQLTATAEIRQGKKEEEERSKKPQDENIIACPIS